MKLRLTALRVLNPNNTMSGMAGMDEGMPAFSGASSVAEAPFTSGVPTPSMSVGSGAGEASVTGSAAGPSATAATGGAAIQTAAVGAAALFGAGAVMYNM